ncbi:hypothetical protein QOZ80_6AG0544360 [Eleusine coracana subsp. coracana]|nr:hypothetical protein QOZ80_6AG0544360 [Eleusine coracana subsp. coracana]
MRPNPSGGDGGGTRRSRGNGDEARWDGLVARGDLMTTARWDSLAARGDLAVTATAARRDGLAARGYPTMTMTATHSYPKSTLSAGFSPIPSAPVRVGEDEPPSSWDLIPSPKVMVSKDSPKFRGSLKLRRFIAAASAIKKKPSPKSCGAKKTVGSPRGQAGTQLLKSPLWIFSLSTKTLVLEETMDAGILKVGIGWCRSSITGTGTSRSPKLKFKTKKSHPKIKKFHNNKATFPLFDDLGELYDGHLAEGNHNFVSLASPKGRGPPSPRP